MLSAVLVMAGTCLFGGLIHADSRWRIASFAGLSVAATAMGLSVRDIKSLPSLFGMVPLTRKAIYYSMAGIIFGILLGMLYNVLKTDSLLPAALTRFGFIAPLIGITEELVFRGFVQSRAAVASGALTSILIAASGHTCYKFLVIRTLPGDLDIHFPSLLMITFLVGMVLGIMRKASGNIFPPALAHALFDVIVYGGATLAPAWVWS